MHYILIISSNIQPSAKAKEIINQAIALLCSADCTLIAYSDYLDPEPPYVNLAVDVESSLEYRDFNVLCKEVESQLGRTPQHKAQGLCPIDIDPVICDGSVLRPEEYGRPYFQLCYRSLCQRQSNG